MTKTRRMTPIANIIEDFFAVWKTFCGICLNSLQLNKRKISQWETSTNACFACSLSKNKHIYIYFRNDELLVSSFVDEAFRINLIEWHRIKKPTPMSINDIPYLFLLACCTGNTSKSTASMATLVITNRSERNPLMLSLISFSSRIRFTLDSSLLAIPSNVNSSPPYSTWMSWFDVDAIDL